MSNDREDPAVDPRSNFLGHPLALKRIVRMLFDCLYSELKSRASRCPE
jgi:hypothetical protein